MRDIAISEVRAFEHEFLETLRTEHQADVLDVLSSGAVNDGVAKIIEKVAADTVRLFKK